MLLLDTHVLLWALMEPERLSDRARQALENPDNTLLVSSASAWEMAVKYRLGRLPGAESVVHGFDRHVKALRATELPMTSQHALLAGRLEVHHRDPFDRVLAAQSLVEGATLVTSDPAMKTFPISIIW